MKFQQELNRRLRQAALAGDVSALVQALEAGADAREDDSWALSSAAEKGHAECVRLLIPVSDPLARESRALRWAAEKGRAECVSLLIPVSDPLAYGSYALQRAAEKGHAECVSLLIPVSDPMANDSLALAWSATSGCAECVRLLLPVSDPLAVGEKRVGAAACAKENGHMHVAEMIEAFIEASALSGAAKNSKRGPRVKLCL